MTKEFSLLGLTADQTKELRNLLETQRTEILANQIAVEVSTDVQDEVDKANEKNETEMQMRLKTREYLYLRKIDQALIEMDKGTYGQCTSCGDEIGFKRLKLRPTSNLCISCKEEQEGQERNNAEGSKSKSIGYTLGFPSGRKTQ